MNGLIHNVFLCEHIWDKIFLSMLRLGNISPIIFWNCMKIC